MIATSTFTDVIHSYLLEHAPQNAAAYRPGLDTQISFGNGRQYRVYRPSGEPQNHAAPSEGEWERVGCSGYSPRDGVAIYATFEFDANHGGVQITAAEREAISDRLTPHCDVTTSTGGQGIHVRAWFDEPISCESREEYSRICQAAIKTLEDLTGFQFADKVESQGCILWLASTNQSDVAFRSGHEFLGTVEIPASAVLLRLEPAPTWADIPSIQITGSHASILEALEQGGAILGKYQPPGGGEVFQTHTALVRRVADALGIPFSTTTTARNLSSPNAYLVAAANEWRVYRLGSGTEPTWTHTNNAGKKYAPLRQFAKLLTNENATMPQIMENLEATEAQIRRVDRALFVDCRKHGICWLESTESLFGYLSSITEVCWKRGVTKGEFFAELQRTAPNHSLIFHQPHYPLIPGAYYTCPTQVPRLTGALNRLLDFFSPETAWDKELIRAAILTQFWGGPPGGRPMFAFRSDAGQGSGKTTAVQKINALTGGVLRVSGNNSEELIKRILSPAAAGLRGILLDNATGLQNSNCYADLITTDVISGKRMFVGEGRIPNLFTWFLTGNRLEFGTDFAQRSVVIHLAKPVYSPTWEAEIDAFIAENAEAIAGDCLALLAGPKGRISECSRRGAWEAEVLACCRCPEDLQALIAERAGQSDAEAAQSTQFEEAIAEALESLGHEPKGVYRLSVGVVTSIYNRVAGESLTKNKLTRLVKQLRQEGRLSRLNCGRDRQSTCYYFTFSPGNKPHALTDFEETQLCQSI